MFWIINWRSVKTSTLCSRSQRRASRAPFPPDGGIPHRNVLASSPQHPPPLAYKWQQQNCKVSRWFSLIVKVCRYQNNWSASLFDKSTFNSFVIVWLKYHVTNKIRLNSHCSAWLKWLYILLPFQDNTGQHEIRPPALTFRSFLFWSKTLLLWPQYSVRDIYSDNM